MTPSFCIFCYFQNILISIHCYINIISMSVSSYSKKKFWKQGKINEYLTYCDSLYRYNYDYDCRTKSSAGLWLGPLAGLTAAATILKEDNSYSEICLLLGITGVGLIVGCLCLYARLIKKDVAVKDFHLLYFLPAIITSTLYLLVANKGTSRQI